MTVVGNSDIQQALKAAAAEIKESVAKHGNVHPVVLQKLEAYIQLLQQAGNQAEVDKWNERAAAIRKILAQQAPAPAPTPAPTPAAAPAPTAAPTDDGAFSLDGADEEEVSYEALEQVAASARQAAAQAPAPTSSAPSDSGTDGPLHLYNSGGEHIATAYGGYIYTPEGKNIGRYQSDFECFVDRAGHYIGQIHEGNRLVRDVNFRYASFNFGDRGNEGDRPGWGRTADIERTMLPLFLDNVRLNDGD